MSALDQYDEETRLALKAAGLQHEHDFSKMMHMYSKRTREILSTQLTPPDPRFNQRRESDKNFTILNYLNENAYKIGDKIGFVWIDEEYKATRAITYAELNILTANIAYLLKDKYKIVKGSYDYVWEVGGV